MSRSRKSVLLTIGIMIVAGYLASDWVLLPAHAARSSKPREIVVVGSKVKDIVRSAGLRSNPEFLEALDANVKRVIQRAIHRAKSNKRGTVRPYDL